MRTETLIWLLVVSIGVALLAYVFTTERRQEAVFREACVSEGASREECQRLFP